MEPRHRVNPKSVFLALAYAPSGKDRIEMILTDYLTEKGFEVRTGREAGAGKYIGEGVKGIIEECSFGVVVYNQLKHNISYEWGLLDGLGRDVVPLRDVRIRIEDIDREFSDKKGVIIPPYRSDSEKEDIIKELKENSSFINAIKGMERELAKRISPEEPEQAGKAARLVAESSLPLGGIEEAREVPNAPEIAKALEAIGKLTAEGHFYRAAAYYYADRLADAEAQLREALKINPNLAEAHNNLGLLLEKADSDEEAEAEYREALRLNPSYAEAHYNLGVLLQKLDRDKEAQAEYREALRVNPNYAKAHNNLGVLLAELNRDEEAEAECREALRLNPEYAEAHYNLGILLQKVARDKEAEAEYREALRLNPNHAKAHNNLGVLLQKLARDKEAEAEYREAVRLNPNLAEAHYNLGNLLQKAGRDRQAEPEYREALRLNPRYAEAHNNLGVLLQKLDRGAEAKSELETAISLFAKQRKGADARKAKAILKRLDEK